MSAVLLPEKDVIVRSGKSDVQVIRRRRREEARPVETVRPTRVAARPSARRFSLPAITVRVVAFGLLMAVSYGASMLAGQTMMESARRDGLRATERIRRARTELNFLSAEVQRLRAPKSVYRWASLNQFSQDFGIDRVEVKPMRVAQR